VIVGVNLTCDLNREEVKEGGLRSMLKGDKGGKRKKPSKE